MRRLALACAVILVVFSWMAIPALSEPTAPAGQEVTLTGKATCTSCEIQGKSCKAGCCEACVKGGDPVMFTDEKGNRYILLRAGGRGTPLMTPERYKMLGGTVAVTGTLIVDKGIQAIQVSKMEQK